MQNRKKTLFGILILTLSNTHAFCQDQTLWQNDNKGTITINPTQSDPLWNGKKIKISFYSDRIVRVTNLPDVTIAPGDTSLIINQKQPIFTHYTTDQSQDSIFIKTNALSLAISKQTGKISFYDNAQSRYLKENSSEALFSPTLANGEKVYQLNKSFLTSEDDNFYGLGQHQADQFNYKGDQVQLFQNNSNIAVPFLISNKGYGILWDNYALSTVGDTRKLLPLSQLNLFDENGAEGWLTEKFYNDSTNLQQPLTTKASSDIYMPYLGDSQKEFPKNFAADKGAIIYSGSISSDETGTYPFYINYGGYITISINGKVVFDRWRQPWNPAQGILRLPLEKGVKNAIQIKWIPCGMEAYLSMQFQSPLSPSLKNQFTFSSQAGKKSDYYFIAGNNMDSTIAGYRQLTGKAVLLPKWAFGFWQSREHYKTQKEVLDVVKTFREKHIPLDNIVQDWNYWKQDQWGSQNFDSSRFPNPSQMLTDLHQKYHTQLMISVWPKFYEGIETYDYFKKQGWLYMRNIADSQRDWIGNGYVSTFYDAFNADARKGFWKLISKRLYKQGIDAWWMDASEPDILSNASPEKRLEEMTPTALGSPALWLNAYPLENARGIYEGQRSENNKRVFLLTRSGFAGSQRFGAAIWSGDIASRWDDMKSQISAGLNYSMSGLPYWTMDAGGFATENKYSNPNAEEKKEWEELQTRWFQFSCFVPIFRVHGQYPYREMFNVASEDSKAFQSMVYYDKLRYKLMPYIYSMAGKAYLHDYTLMRGLPMDFGDDKEVANIGDEYMFGDAFLVNPIYTYQSRTRKLYLPKNANWYNMNTGEYLTGGKWIHADAPFEQIPVFVKAGSIIPTGPQMEYVAEKKTDPLTIYIFEGADGHFDLYEDNGLDYNYEKGKFSSIPLDYNNASRSITIGNREGNFEGMLTNRKIQLVFVSKENHSNIFDNKITKSIDYKGKAASIKL